MATLKKISECKRELEIEIPADEALKEYKKIVNKYSLTAKLPGFRPGKAPQNIVKRVYEADIQKALIESLVPHVLEKELKAENVTPLTTPKIETHPYSEGESLRIKAKFEVWPEFNLPEYKKYKIKLEESTVYDEEVEQYLKELQTKLAEYIPVEGRGVVDGDYLIVELSGEEKKSGKRLSPEKVSLIAGNFRNERIINEKIRGLKIGEETSFVFEYDRDHPNRKLAGKKILYRMKLISLKERKLPFLDDNFARSLGEHESLTELKNKIREEIKESKIKKAKEAMAEEILDRIWNDLNFELPESLLHIEQQEVLRRTLEARSQSNFQKEELEQLTVQSRKEAERNLYRKMILREIVKKENIVVSEEDLNQELKKIAELNNLPLPTLIERVEKEGKKESLRNSILMRKAVDFLVEKVIIK